PSDEAFLVCPVGIGPVDVEEDGLVGEAGGGGDVAVPDADVLGTGSTRREPGAQRVGVAAAIAVELGRVRDRRGSAHRHTPSATSCATSSASSPSTEVSTAPVSAPMSGAASARRCGR